MKNNITLYYNSCTSARFIEAIYFRVMLFFRLIFLLAKHVIPRLAHGISIPLEKLIVIIRNR
jgi:hypothetical protein